METLKIGHIASVLFITLGIAGCWDREYGPVLWNDFGMPIEITAKFSGDREYHFRLEPGGTLGQRTKNHTLEQIILSDISGQEILRLDAGAILATGLSEKKDVLVLAPGGVRAEASR